jgi:hypothetical protein
VSSLVLQFAPFSRRLGAVFALLGGLTGCQPLDTAAALGDPSDGEAEGFGAGLEKPTIELADGSTVADGCAAVSRQAHDILEQSCARCHGGGNPGARQGAPPFDCVLDTESLIAKVSVTAKDPDTSLPARFLVPGDPDHSRIYLRPLHGEMPPPDVVGLPPNPRPTVSDLSVLRHWIASCVSPTDMQAGDTDVADEGASDIPNDDAP